MYLYFVFYIVQHSGMPSLSFKIIYRYTLPLLWRVDETLLCIVCQNNAWKLQGPQVKMLQTFLVCSAEMQVADGGKFRYFQ